MVVFPDHDMNGTYFMYATEGIVQNKASYEKLKAAVKESFEGGYDWHLKHRVDLDFKTQVQQYKSEAAEALNKAKMLAEENAAMQKKIEMLMAASSKKASSSSSSSSTSLSLVPYRSESSSSSSQRQPASRPKPSAQGFKDDNSKGKDKGTKRMRKADTSSEEDNDDDEEEEEDAQPLRTRKSPRKATAVGGGGKKQSGNGNKRARR